MEWDSAARVWSRGLNPLLAALVFTLVAGGGAAQSTESTLEASRTGDSESPYRRSLLTYRNAATVTSALPGANTTYNPFYGMQLEAGPYYWINANTYLRGSFTLFAELTERDESTRHVYVSDLTVAGGRESLATIPLIEADLSLEAYANLPASRESRVRSLWSETGLTASVSRQLPVLRGLVVSYELDASKGWYGATSGAESQRLDTTCGSGIASDCNLVFDGVRNPSWGMSHALSAALRINESLSAVAAFKVATAFLYALTPDERTSLRPSSPTNARYYYGGMVGAQLALTPSVGLAGGFKGFGSELAPDGTYRFPLFNRTTQLFVEVRTNLAALAAELTES